MSDIDKNLYEDIQQKKENVREKIKQALKVIQDAQEEINLLDELLDMLKSQVTNK